MSKLTNNEVIKLVNMTLDPIMKNEGFSRSGRIYYKKVNDLIFILQTSAVGHYFSEITGWPSHSFGINCGVWCDGISEYIFNLPKRRDKNGTLIPDYPVCEGIDEINRKAEHPYRFLGLKYGANKVERKRNDIWIMPDNVLKQKQFLNELVEQVKINFLDNYKKYTNYIELEHLLVGKRHDYNIEAGYSDDMVFDGKTCIGNFNYYLQYAILFYKKYGPKEKYLKYLKRYEEWCSARGEKVKDCYYT